MIKRRNFISRYTYNILNNFPSWMKLQKENSNGFNLINSVGQELENIDQQFNENFNDIFIKTANLNQLKNLYFIDKRNLINKITLEASGYSDNIPIYVVKNEYDLLNNKPTRIEYITTHNLFSGYLPNLLSGIYNIRYFYNNISGYYYIINDVTAINPSSVLIYDDNYRYIDNMSYASGRMDYEHFGIYETLEPESSGYLMTKYPTHRLMTSGDPVNQNVIKYWYDLHYEPQNASGYPTKWYFDEDGNLKYYLTALNNPYGSGRFNLSSGYLSFIPVEHSIKVYDILNLNQSGEATEIPMSGISLYQYTSPSGDFKYIGYNETVPQVYKGYAGSTATYLYQTSWFQGRTSGFLDNDVPPHSGTFQYIQGTGELNNILWFNNPISKYMIKYDYSKFDYLQDIATDSKYNYNIDLIPANPILLTQDEDKYVNIPWEFAKSSISGIRIDPDYIRPGRDIKITVTINDPNTKIWVNPSGTPFNFNIYRKNLGYTQEICDTNYAKLGY